MKKNHPFVLRCLLAPFLTMLLGLFLLFRELVFSLPAPSLWASDFDTPLIYWIINWGYHVVFELGRPLDFYQANAFFPHLNTLAYSDSLLGLQVLYAPLRLLGIDSLAALYLSLMLTVLAAGLVSAWLLNRIGLFSWIEICLILFASFFSLSATGYLIHYQLFGFYWTVPFVLSLYLFLQRPNTRDLILVCLFYMLGAAVAIYLAPILLVYTLVLTVPFVLMDWSKNGRSYLRSLFQWKFFAILLVSGLFLYFIHLRPYFLIQQDSVPVDVERAILFSATPLSLLQKSAYSFWYTPTNPLPGMWESAYFPGYLLLLLALAFVIQRVWPVLARKKAQREPLRQEASQPAAEAAERFTAYILLFLVACLLFSLGPYLKKDADSAYSIPMPFYFVSKVIPGLDQMRSPGRFGMMIGLPLAVLGVRFLQQMSIKKTWKNLLAVFLLAALVVESLPNFQVYPFNPDPDGTYTWLAGQIQPGSSLLELPLSKRGEDENPVASLQLVGSTIHWARLVSGYGAQESPEYRALADADKQVQLGKAAPRTILDLARGIPVEWMLIHRDRYDEPVFEQWQAALAGCTVSRDAPGRVLLVQLSTCP